MLRRIAVILLALVAAIGMSACGEEDTEVQQGELAAAESEALYVDLADPTDQAYFQNIAPAEAQLEEGNVWFGVFIRVENEGDEPRPAAEEFSIEDTQGNEFEPVESENAFGYRPVDVPGGGYIPNPEALQAQAGTQGQLLLFQIPLESLDNRPLELIFSNPQDPEDRAAIDLDV